MAAGLMNGLTTSTQPTYQDVPDYTSSMAAQSGGNGAAQGAAANYETGLKEAQTTRPRNLMGVMKTAGAIAGGIADLNKAGPKLNKVDFIAPSKGQIQDVAGMLQGSRSPEIQQQSLFVPQAGQVADLNLLDLFSKFSGRQ